MPDLRYEHFFIVGWVFGCLLLLASVVVMWVYRAPGTRLADLIDQPGHRVFHKRAEMMRFVRPEKRRLIYVLQLTGATICASLTIIPLLLNLIFPGVFE